MFCSIIGQYNYLIAIFEICLGLLINGFEYDLIYIFYFIAHLNLMFFGKGGANMLTKFIWCFVIIILFILGCLIYKVREKRREGKIQIDKRFYEIQKCNHQMHLRYREHMPFLKKSNKVKRLESIIKDINSLCFWAKHSIFLSRIKYQWWVFFWGQS
jgi:preprotein translocase subunit SecG